MRRRVAVAAGLGGLAVLVVLVAVLAMPVDRPTGSNSNQSVTGLTVTVPASRTSCQRANIPADTDRITIYAERRLGAGPLQIQVRDRGRLLSRARVARFPRETAYAADLRPAVAAEVSRGRICFDNDGPLNIVLAGNRPLGPRDPTRKRIEVRTDFSKAGQTARIGLAADVGRRLPLAKSAVLGTWTLWVVAVVFLVTAGAGVRLLIREAAP